MIDVDGSSTFLLLLWMQSCSNMSEFLMTFSPLGVTNVVVRCRLSHIVDVGRNDFTLMIGMLDDSGS